MFEWYCGDPAHLKQAGSKVGPIEPDPRLNIEASFEIGRVSKILCGHSSKPGLWHDGTASRPCRQASGTARVLLQRVIMLYAAGEQENTAEKLFGWLDQPAETSASHKSDVGLC